MFSHSYSFKLFSHCIISETSCFSWFVNDNLPGMWYFSQHGSYLGQNNFRMYLQGKYWTVLPKRRLALILDLLRNKMLLCGYEILDTEVEFVSFEIKQMHFIILLFLPCLCVESIFNLMLTFAICYFRSRRRFLSVRWPQKKVRKNPIYSETASRKGKVSFGFFGFFFEVIGLPTLSIHWTNVT